MNSDQGKNLLDKFFIFLWIGFCLVYYLPPIIKGGVSLNSPVWYFESQVQWIPFSTFGKNCLREGIFPAWSPHFYGGFPLLAYPPFYGDFLIRILGNYRGSFVMHLFWFLLIGPLFYRGLRKLALSPVASFFGLLCFLGSLYYNISMAYLPFPMLTAPVVFWSAVSILRERIRLSYLLALGFSFGLGLGCDVERNFYLFSAIILFSFFLARPVKWKRILVLLLAPALALVLELCPVLSLAGYEPFSLRGQGITFQNFLGENAFPGFKIVLALALNPFPAHLPVELQAVYPGLVCWLMFCLGIKRLGVKGGLIGLFLLGVVLYALGWAPLCRLLFQLPLVNKFALHYSASIVFYLGLAIVASVGAEEFLERKSRVISYILLGVLLIIIIGSFLLPLLRLKPDWIRMGGILISLGIGGALILQKRTGRDWRWSLFLLLAIIFDVSYLGFKLQPRARKKDLEPSQTVLNFLAQERRLVRFWTVSKDLYADTLVHPLAGMNLPIDLPGTHSPFGYWRVPPMRMAQLLNLVSPGYLRFDPERKLDFVDGAKPRDPAELGEDDLYFLRFLNVGNIISRGKKLEIAGLKYLGSRADIHFYQLIQTLPRYLLVSRIKILSREKILEQIAKQELEPQTMALVEKNIEFSPSNFNPGHVYLKKFFPGKWEFELELPASGSGDKSRSQYFLVLGENYLPGWRAFSGDKELRIYRANYAFLGIPLLAGYYSLKIVYFPYQTRIGLWCGIASIGFWIILVLGAIVKLKLYSR